MLSLYLARAVLVGVALTSLLLVGIYTLIEFIREARSLSGDYGGSEMLRYLLQTTPRRLYDIFPFAALIGTLLGLGSLASGNELVAMRAAGFDRRHLALRVLVAVGVCLAAMLALAEWVIPDLETQARAERQQARTGQLHVGELGQFWLRDGSHVLRLGQSVWLDEARLEFTDVLVYRLGPDMRPLAIVQAAQARHLGDAWRLTDVSWRQVADDARGADAELVLESGLSPELFLTAVNRPRLLAMSDLQQMRVYLRQSGLDAETYDQALWTRLFFPVNVLAMVLVGLPFVFQGARGGLRGIGLFAGVALGLVFFVLSRLSQSIGMIMPMPLW
ncbi:MAG: LPS export ABC transporter permease LptG, partial [Wenzhouxiangella sp.]